MSINRNFAKNLLDEGYSSCELSFRVTLKRRGIMKWLEDKKIIKSKMEGFSLMVRDFNRVDVLSSSDPSIDIASISNVNVNGLRG